MKLPSAVLGALEIAINQYLSSDTQALQRCAALSGRSLAVHLSDFDLELYFLPHAQGLQLADKLDGAAYAQGDTQQPDVRLSGSSRVFANTLFAKGSGSLMGAGLRIEGDVGLAQGFAQMFQHVDVDIEDWLEPRIGDVPAHLLGRVLRGAGGFMRRAASTLSLDTAEYLREETRDLVHRDEVAQWTQEVDRLRADTDRLQARLRRLNKG